MKYALLGGFLVLGLSVSAFGSNVGFCPTSTSDCHTATGLGGETIGISDSFYMNLNGNATSSSPWNLLVAIPDYSGSAPTLTSPDFTLSSVSAGTDFYSTSSGSIYDLFGLTGDSSMNASNLFGSNETSALGSTPSFFDVFDYTFTPAFTSGPYYPFTGALPAGTFLAGTGGSNPTSTPFTTAGLINGPGCPDCGQGNVVPEPSQLGALLLGAGLLGFVQFRKRRQAA